MKNPLTTLDELIWTQFEKVTQYAHKKVGWNKYDLARITDTLFAVSGFGVGTYMGIAGYSDNNSFVVGNGAVVAGGAICFNYLSQSMIKTTEKLEDAITTLTGAGVAPKFKAWRPLELLSATCIISAGMAISIGGYVLPPALEQHKLPIGLTLAMLGNMALFNVMTSYFLDQLMTPPKAKKSLWNAAYESVASLGKYFKPAPKPVEAPAAKYGIEGHAGT